MVQSKNGKIIKIIDNLNEETRMILINFIYLKANYTYLFDEKYTHQEKI